MITSLQKARLQILTKPLMSIPTILSITSAFFAILSLRNVMKMHENNKAYERIVHKGLENYRRVNTDMIELLKIIQSSETSDEILKKFSIYIGYKD